MSKRKTKKTAAARKRNVKKTKPAKKSASRKTTKKKKTTSKKKRISKSTGRGSKSKRTVKKKSPNRSSRSNGTPTQSKSATIVDSNSLSTAARPFVTERIVSLQEIRAEHKARHAELAEQRKRAHAVLKKLRRTLTAKRCKYGKVSGYSVTLRSKLGHVVSPLQYVIEIHVPRKFTDRVMQARDDIQWIPKEIQGVPIKVSESKATFLGGTCFRDGDALVPYDPENNEQHRRHPQLETSCTDRVLGGLPIFSISHEHWGTLGLRLPTKPDVSLIGITNAHVSPENKRVVQPALEDSLTVDEIGEVKSGDSKFKIEPDGVFKIDAALISLSGPRRVEVAVEGFDADSFFGLSNPDYFFAGRRLKLEDENIYVYKRGAKIKEPVRGKLRDANFEEIVIEDEFTGITRKFHDPIRVTASRDFIDKGDSGSAMLIPIAHPTDEHRTALLVAGIFFAKTSNHQGFACHFADIVTAFDLTAKLDPPKLITHWTVQES